MEVKAKFDWGQLPYGSAVLCEFRPRDTYNGRGMKPGLTDKRGVRFTLERLWHMGDDDPYPGEYALSTHGGCGKLMDELGITWVASGDVVVVTPNAD